MGNDGARDSKSDLFSQGISPKKSQELNKSVPLN